MIHRRAIASTLAALAIFAGLAQLRPALAQKPTDVVFVTRTGDKYHRDGCRYLKSRIQTTREAAEKSGKTPCKVCRP